MFKCKICIEKDKMIAELSKQIGILRTLAYPSSVTNSQAFIQSLEANKILGGETETVNLNSDDLLEHQANDPSFDSWN